jgi:hypothetical protein
MYLKFPDNLLISLLNPIGQNKNNEIGNSYYFKNEIFNFNIFVLDIQIGGNKIILGFLFIKENTLVQKFIDETDSIEIFEKYQILVKTFFVILKLYLNNYN